MLVAARAGGGGVSAYAGGAAAIDGTDAVPVTEDSADADCRVVLRPLPAGTGGGAVVVAPGVSPAPRYGLRGFPPKALTVTVTVITSTTTPVTAWATSIAKRVLPMPLAPSVGPSSAASRRQAARRGCGSAATSATLAVAGTTAMDCVGAGRR